MRETWGECKVRVRGSVRERSSEIVGTLHLVKISGNFGSAVSGKRFIGSSHWKIPGKSGKSKRQARFPGWNVPNGISCSIYTFQLGSHLGVSSDNGFGAVPELTIKCNNFSPIGKSGVRSIGKSGFRFSNSKSGFPNRTRNPKTDFTSEKFVRRVDFNPDFMDFLFTVQLGNPKLFSWTVIFFLLSMRARARALFLRTVFEILFWIS